MKLARFLMNEIQTVYRLQGVKINDKHFEIIIRQMLKWNKIIDPGDTRFMFDQQIEKWELYEENNRVIEKGLQPATAEPLLLGITKVSLSSDSFITAASFQYTSKVLINAAMAGKIDYLTGVQKNVIIGKLINAGTGFQQTSYDF